MLYTFENDINEELKKIQEYCFEAESIMYPFFEICKNKYLESNLILGLDNSNNLFEKIKGIKTYDNKVLFNLFDFLSAHYRATFLSAQYEINFSNEQDLRPNEYVKNSRLFRAIFHNMEITQWRHKFYFKKYLDYQFNKLSEDPTTLKISIYELLIRQVTGYPGKMNPSSILDEAMRVLGAELMENKILVLKN